MRWADAAVAAWVAVWLAIGAWIGVDLHHLGDLGTSVASSGEAVQRVGEAMQQLGHLPLVGGIGGRVGGEITTLGSQVAAQGRASVGQVHQLAILLAVAVGGIPLTPVLGVYLPLRVRRVRQIAAVREALARRTEREAVVELLAYQAAQNLPLRQLLMVTRTPWRDLAAGRFTDLAEAELRRLGLPSLTRSAQRE